MQVIGQWVTKKKLSKSLSFWLGFFKKLFILFLYSEISDPNISLQLDRLDILTLLLNREMKRFVLIILDDKIEEKQKLESFSFKPVLYTSAQELIMLCSIAASFKICSCNCELSGFYIFYYFYWFKNWFFFFFFL